MTWPVQCCTAQRPARPSRTRPLAGVIEYSTRLSVPSHLVALGLLLAQTLPATTTVQLGMEAEELSD